MPVLVVTRRPAVLHLSHIAPYATKSGQTGQASCANIGSRFIQNGSDYMELVKTIIEEFHLRDRGERGKLTNLSDLQLICLAYKLGIKPVG